MASVLVVEDDRAIARLLLEFLRDRGHEARQAGGGMEALSLMRQRKFDLVLLDIAMPGISGIETLRQLKVEFPSTAVIMISGVSDEQVALMSLTLGASDFLRKPFDLDYLDRVVAQGLALTP